MKFLKELYGAGILFFYYIKYFVLIGYPVLLYGLDYKPSTYMDILWVYCLALMTKDIIFKFVLKKSYCDRNSCRSIDPNTEIDIHDCAPSSHPRASCKTIAEPTRATQI
jgi:hypothetical protein